MSIVGWFLVVLQKKLMVDRFFLEWIYPKLWHFIELLLPFRLLALPENYLPQTSDGIFKSQAKLKPVFQMKNWFHSGVSAMLTLFFPSYLTDVCPSLWRWGLFGGKLKPFRPTPQHCPSLQRQLKTWWKRTCPRLAAQGMAWPQATTQWVVPPHQPTPFRGVPLPPCLIWAWASKIGMSRWAMGRTSARCLRTQFLPVCCKSQGTGGLPLARVRPLLITRRHLSLRWPATPRTTRCSWTFLKIILPRISQPFMEAAL